MRIDYDRDVDISWWYLVDSADLQSQQVCMALIHAEFGDAQVPQASKVLIRYTG